MGEQVGCVGLEVFGDGVELMPGVRGCHWMWSIDGGRGSAKAREDRCSADSMMWLVRILEGKKESV